MKVCLINPPDLVDEDPRWDVMIARFRKLELVP